MIDSLFDDSFSTRQQQGAQRARRLARLRRLIELAEDPSDIFDSCTEFMEALAAEGSSKGPFRTSDPGAISSSLVAQAQQEQSQETQQNLLLALTLCAALSEPAKRHEEAGSTSTLSAAAGGAGTALGRSNSACWRSSPVVSSSRFTPAATQLHPSFSMPPSMGAASEMGSDSVGAAAAPAYELPRSFSGAQLEADSSYRGNPVSSAHSSIQLQHGQLQPQRQHPSDAGALFQLLCQELQGEQTAQLPRARSPGQQPVRQQQPMQQQPPPQLPDQEQQKAVLLERLKRAIAVAASRKSMEV